MTCKKCGYQEPYEKKIFGSTLCSICATFAPEQLTNYQDYIQEKLDWKILETYRKHRPHQSKKHHQGMHKQAAKGKTVTRAPKGYSIMQGTLIPNEEASKIHSLYKTFMNRNYSLNSLAKHYGISTNGIKKILTNRTYLGEIKFAGNIYPGKHEGIISPALYYATQRKLEGYRRKKKK